MTQTTPATDAASVRQRIEDVLGRHEQALSLNAEQTPLNFCMHCRGRWPCDAYTMAEQLRDAVEALEAIDRTQATNVYHLKQRARAALRRMAQGEGE